jgi:hypothetical protein
VFDLYRTLRIFLVILLIFSPSLIILTIIGAVFQNTPMFVVAALVMLPINARAAFRGRLRRFGAAQFDRIKQRP